ncbi:mitochondrial carrier domain-containing protein [Glomus cerebriforme]|uniref:Mitochondrial carrier domain-containing protein n=1 Tax=Glomus cerebriforme TaxID=658196 RepID=A0A397TJQ1_9GLOM|nr:mitochondrial carrier domain-containing protein [Glomus cerebriforme]
MLAGGLGGSTADFLMHSIDTVKTRLQGQKLAKPPKYQNMLHAYTTIFKQEGLTRGLYGGVAPAMLGSVPATTIYFGTYEFVKRNMIGFGIGVPDTVVHLIAGSIGDIMASVVYVPSEVLKTRLQLQGRYNNPHFVSGYNYKNTRHAAQMIYKLEGPSAFYHGYKATLLRDVPFSALQFAFYEKFKLWAMMFKNSNNLSLEWEIATGAFAGGLAGALTTPLDVIKTLLQTQRKPSTTKQTTSTPSTTQKLTHYYYSGIWEGMLWNYRDQGIGGLFRGIGPRVAWTAMQSGLMFVIYEQVLEILEKVEKKNIK